MRTPVPAAGALLDAVVIRFSLFLLNTLRLKGVLLITGTIIFLALIATCALT